MIKVPANLLSGENPLLGCRVLTSHFALTWLREERALRSPFPKGLVSFTEAPLSQPDCLQKARPSSITLGVRISSCEFRGDRNAQTIAGSNSHGSLNSISVSWDTFTNHPYSTYAQQSLRITVSVKSLRFLSQVVDSSLLFHHFVGYIFVVVVHDEQGSLNGNRFIWLTLGVNMM